MQLFHRCALCRFRARGLADNCLVAAQLVRRGAAAAHHYSSGKGNQNSNGCIGWWPSYSSTAQHLEQCTRTSWSPLQSAAWPTRRSAARRAAGTSSPSRLVHRHPLILRSLCPARPLPFEQLHMPCSLSTHARMPCPAVVRAGAGAECQRLRLSGVQVCAMHRSVHHCARHAMLLQAK